MVRLLAIDLDGTLLRGDGTVSPRGRQALGRAREAGLVIVVVTARPVRIVRVLSEGLSLSGLVVCSGGAHLYDLSRDRVWLHRPLGQRSVQAAMSALRAALPDVSFGAEIGLTFACEPDYPHHALQEGAVAPLTAALLAQPVTKLVAHSPTHTVEEMLAAGQASLRDEASVSTSGGNHIDVMAPGVDKASTLAEACRIHGVAAEEVVAFGDMTNDLPMLRWAGRGVAVANARPEVLAVADEIAPSNDDDGVAQVIEALLAPEPPPA
jgi:Cof subfamily protein (haloacid dehalogenase superfamily)